MLTSITSFNRMTFVLTETTEKKRLLIVMSSDIIPFAFGNIGRLTDRGKNRSNSLWNSDLIKFARELEVGSTTRSSILSNK